MTLSHSCKIWRRVLRGWSRTIKSSTTPGVPSRTSGQPLLCYSRGTARYIRDSCGRIKEISANRENFYAELECRNLRSGEDPAIFKWELENLLAKADPSLPADAKKALIARQMRCLTRTLKFKLLEHKPTIQCRTGLRVTKHQQAQRLQPNSQQGIKGRNHSVRFYVHGTKCMHGL